MKKLLIIIALFVAADASAVKLCREDPCRAIDNWKNAGGDIGSGTYNSSAMTWNLSVTAFPGGTVAGEAGCFSSNTSASGSGGYCWCKVTSVNSASCSGSWVFRYYDGGDYQCANACAFGCSSCARNGSATSCSRSALFSEVTSSEVSAVTCPIVGTCTNTNYKTIEDSDLCGSGWVETTVPALTISNTGTDGKGSYVYGACAK
jgi:hypothetical protein